MEIAQAGIEADQQGARQSGEQEFERIEQQDGGGDGMSGFRQLVKLPSAQGGGDTPQGCQYGQAEAQGD